MSVTLSNQAWVACMACLIGQVLGRIFSRAYQLGNGTKYEARVTKLFEYTNQLPEVIRFAGYSWFKDIISEYTP